MAPVTSPAGTDLPPSAASLPAPRPAALDLNPDAPVRVEVAMPRGLFDHLTCREDGPRCRYDMATGQAEFVAEPGPAHDWRAHGLSHLFFCVMDALAAAGRRQRFFVGGATRLLSSDGAFEPDTSLFIDPPDAPDLMEFDGYLDARKGHPVPHIVVEIDRSVSSSGKLAPYFRMGVREAWTWSRADGARIWVADPRAADGFRAVERSVVLAGLGRADLDRLLAGRDPAGLAREIGNQVARTMLSASGLTGMQQ